MTHLTSEEQKSIRFALRVLKTQFGSVSTLARAMRLQRQRVSGFISGKEPISAELLLRVARTAHVGIDDVLTGKYPPPGTCPHCGRRP